MPCGDGGSNGFTRTEYVESGAQTQRLCGVFTALATLGLLERVLNAVDWKEAGISRTSTEAWWQRHKRADAERKAMEEAERIRKAKRKAVISTLTPEQKRILNIKD